MASVVLAKSLIETFTDAIFSTSELKLTFTDDIYGISDMVTDAIYTPVDLISINPVIPCVSWWFIIKR